MAAKTPADRFKQNMDMFIALTRELVGIANEKGASSVTPAMVDLAEAFIGGYSAEKRIDSFIEHSYKYWDQIYSKNEEFFFKHTGEVFGSISNNRIDLFKELFSAKDSSGNQIISAEDKQAIWSFFTAFVKISLSHVHLAKGPVIITEDGVKKPRYRKRAYPEITKLQHYASAERFDVDLWSGMS